MRSPWHQTRPDENTVQFSSNDLLSDDIDVCNICHQTKIQLFSGASQLYTFCRHDCTLIVSEKTLNKLSETLDNKQSILLLIVFLYNFTHWITKFKLLKFWH